MIELRYIRDAIHSFVSFEKEGLINKLIDTEEFQRMRDIRQTGFSYLTYPSAVHSRFSHSLGTYWLAKRVGDILLSKEEEKLHLKIAGLLHDIGHGPFSHALEKMIMPNISHEELSCSLIESRKHCISKILNDNGIDPCVISGLISGTIKPKYLHKIISSPLDVDRFDYLLRDSLMTGNPNGGFDLERIIQTIKISKTDEIYISKKGWDAVEHYLNCRYQMYKQVYFHHTTISAEELVRKLLQRAKDLYRKGQLTCHDRYKPLLNSSLDLDSFVEFTDTDILNIIKECKWSSDPILKDLQKRFANRDLFKSIPIPVEDAPILFERKEKIVELLESKKIEPKYYFSIVLQGSKDAYWPYTPEPRDEENFIYISDDCSKEISDEIRSLRAIRSKSQYFVFLPDEKCKKEAKRILSVN